jgi:hypothetical protein
MYIYVYVYMYMYMSSIYMFIEKTEMENGSLFSLVGKR